MIEYRIEVLAHKKHVYAIWKKFLKDDNKWHYTLEDTYIELRVEKKIMALDVYLKRKGWKYTTFQYEDAIPITKKYQKQFEKIFHGYSELAMETMHWKKRDDIPKLLERCMHLAHNAFEYGLYDEAISMAKTAVGRAYFAGQQEILRKKGEEND